MKLLHPQKPLSEPTAVTIGTFDGVHLGHKLIFRTLTDIAEKNNLKTVLVTFEPPPKRFFSKGKIQNLTTLREKLTMLEDLGIQNVLVLPFNQELVTTGYSGFIQNTLIDILKAETLVAGYDFRFGHNRDGDPNNIPNLNVIEVPPFQLNGEPVKSSLIRSLIENGNIEKAKIFLGHDYMICGEKIHGMAIGRTLGFPTINLKVDPEKLLPQKGVYTAKDENLGHGLLYIGNRPTFDNGKTSVEIHFMDAPPENYSLILKLSLFSMLRTEKKFSNKIELVKQLSLDKNRLKHLLQQNE